MTKTDSNNFFGEAPCEYLEQETMKYLFPGNSGSNYDDIAIWGLQGKMSTDESDLLSTS